MTTFRDLPTGLLDAVNAVKQQSRLAEIRMPGGLTYRNNITDDIAEAYELAGYKVKFLEEKKELDPVDKKAVKKDFDDRKDKDIDNDGDTDDSDEYLHKRRKAISKKTTTEKMSEIIKKKDDKKKKGEKDKVDVDPELPIDNDNSGE